MKSSELKILFILFGMLCTLQLGAQELECRVVVNSIQIQTTERRVFTEMEDEFSRFISDRKWTSDEFQDQERIKCALMINLDKVSGTGNYSGSIQVISVRPTFNTTYETSVVNFGDKDFNFEYVEGQAMNYSDNSYTSNLTSMLAYFAQMVLAYDYDTFSELGGTDMFNRALQTVNNAQQSGFSGWDQFNSIKNRYWWTNNALNRNMKPFREAVYQYHRLGLDQMAENPEEGKLNIMEAMVKIDKVNSAMPQSLLVRTFLDSKSDELISMFSQGDLNMRRQAFELLKRLDPARSEEFKKILSN
ncbi:MAG: DUF4835 family protein [Reichenbachiella sp.]